MKSLKRILGTGAALFVCAAVATGIFFLGEDRAQSEESTAEEAAEVPVMESGAPATLGSSYRNDLEFQKFVSTDEGPAIRGTLSMSISTNPLPGTLNDREFQKFVRDGDSNVTVRVYLGDQVITGAVGSGGIVVTQAMGTLYISGSGGGGDPTNWSWYVAVSNVLPNASNTLDLGSLELPFRDLFLGTNSVYMGGVKVLSFDPSTSQLVFEVQSKDSSGNTNLVDGDDISRLNNDAGYVTENTDTNAVWGNISGTLANQTDLQTALDAKLNTNDATYLSTVSLAASALQPGSVVITNVESRTLVQPQNIQDIADTVMMFPVLDSAHPNGIQIMDVYLGTSESGTFPVEFERWDDPTNSASAVTIHSLSTSGSVQTNTAPTGTNLVSAGQIIMLDLPTNHMGFINVSFSFKDQ